MDDISLALDLGKTPLELIKIACWKDIFGSPLAIVLDAGLDPQKIKEIDKIATDQKLPVICRNKRTPIPGYVSDILRREGCKRIIVPLRGNAIGIDNVLANGGKWQIMVQASVKKDGVKCLESFLEICRTRGWNPGAVLRIDQLYGFKIPDLYSECELGLMMEASEKDLQSLENLFYHSRWVPDIIIVEYHGDSSDKILQGVEKINTCIKNHGA